MIMDARLDEAALRESDLLAFQIAIERGEYVAIIQGAAPEQASPRDVPAASREEAAYRLAQLRESGTRAKEAVSIVADSFSLPKNLVYRLWVETGPRHRG